MTTIKNTLIELRHTLHKHPELAGEERLTATIIQHYLEQLGISYLKDIGGHGILITLDSGHPGPSTLLRADMDALPITEQGNHAHKSVHEGNMHACGHDGHSAALLAFLTNYRACPIKRGQLLVVFQPAEETGEGARNVVNDPLFPKDNIDYIFGFHNLPGFALHQIAYRDDTFSCASTGVRITLEGQSAHASQPQAGNSPLNAMQAVLTRLDNLSTDIEQQHGLLTITHCQLGEESYGIAPGHAMVSCTLRSEHDKVIQDALHKITMACKEVAQQFDIQIDLDQVEPFNSTQNHPEANSYLLKAARQLKLDTYALPKPMAWSEDVGVFTTLGKGAFFGIGSGEHHPALHTHDYDFPDAIIDTAARLYSEIVKQIHG